MNKLVYIALLGYLIQGSTAANESPLPFTPKCGTASSAESVNYNSGIQLDQISTLYVFGDSLSATGNHHGGPAPPAVPKGDSPLYGGRASNGLLWDEVFLTKPGAQVANFAVGGAVIDRSLYKLAKPTVTDMPQEVQTYLDKKLKVDSASSLTSVYFGVNDFALSTKDRSAPRTLPLAAHKYLQEIERLIKSGMTQFLIITPPVKRDSLLEHNKIIWQGMLKYEKSYKIRFARIEMGDLFEKITKDPKAFNLVDDQACLKHSQTTVGACPNPKAHPYWMSGHPEAETQKTVAKYITKVLQTCGTKPTSGSVEPKAPPK